MDKILSGVSRFQKDVYPEHQELFEELANGQAPEALFLTCSDSRVDPNMITQTKPGDLFICRNAGNIVPPHLLQGGGMTASIEFGVAALNVKHLIVCGHTDCGAMKGALNPNGLDALPHVRDWLSHSFAAVSVVKELNTPEDELLDRLTEHNVLLQLQHLRTHPAVAAKLATDELQLHGWVYDIESGEVRAYDFDSRTWLPLGEAERIKHHLGDHTHAAQ
ncbi:carbonic anhydrase [Yunchengibacter salinarum]|uniref:carbonic anhydrase n=1 Tax=Yunchengibacter salinarum TaxID=3133399 RepID=UPI0035B67001